MLNYSSRRTTVPVVDNTKHLTAERRDLADFLEGLTSDEWSSPSLCAAWTIRDVAAHLISNLDLTVPQMAMGTLRAGLKPNRFIERRARTSLPGLSPADAAAAIRANADDAARPSDFLPDTMIHHQDMRRPLEASRAIPAERLIAGIELTAQLTFPFNGKKRTKELSFRATDIDWSTGAGPVVTGSGEALMMAIAGRPSAAQELHGPGVAELQRRIGDR